MSTSSTQWWIARPGSQPEGPFNADAVVARLASSGGAAGWVVCRVGASVWSDPRSDAELAARLMPMAPPAVPPVVIHPDSPMRPAAPGAPIERDDMAGRPAAIPSSTGYPPGTVPPTQAPYAPRPGASPNKGLIIFLHISQLAGYVIPGLGWILPLVLWLTNRDKPDVDRHGKEVVNFMIIVVPSICISAVLMIVLIGALLLPLVLIGQLVCVILAVVKASNDEFFSYPMPFRIIK